VGLVLAGALGLVVYAALLHLLGVPEVRAVAALARARVQGAA
jgi:hypothetical protein